MWLASCSLAALRASFLMVSGLATVTSVPAACPDTALSDPIPDPGAWAASCSGGPGKCTITEFTADIDSDGSPELFLSCLEAHGNAGGTYLVFRRDGQRNFYLGSLFLHSLAFRVLPVEADLLPRMALYHRLGGADGWLVIVTYTGREFAVASRERIEPMARDHDRYLEMFGDTRPLPAAAPVSNFRPAIPIDEALEIAKRYIAEHGIDLSDQYIASAALVLDGQQPPHWRVQWAWTRPRLGGEYGLRIDMDGAVHAAPLGP